MTDHSPKAPKSLLGFYVTAGFLLVLALAGYFAWAPLRLAYAIRQVRGIEKEGWLVTSGGDTQKGRMVLICLEGARRGSSTAIDVLIERADVLVLEQRRPGVFFGMAHSVAYRAALDNPEGFFERLRLQSDEHVLWVLSKLNTSLRGLHQPYLGNVLEAKAIEKHFKSHADSLSKLGQPEQLRVAKAALGFVRKRFPSRQEKASK